jgi:sugar phosphate isomerase/epimerase
MILTINCDEISDNIQKATDFFLINKLNYIELRSINKKNLLDYSQNEIKELKNQLTKKRLKIIAIASPLFKWFYNKPISSIKFDNFFFNPVLSKNQKKEYIKKAFIIAELLETNFIRIFSNLSDGTIPPNIFWNDELLFYALEKAKHYKKYLLLENEPICIICKKKDVKKTFKKIDNAYFKLWMDVANFYQVGDSILEKDIQDMKEVIKYVHLKDFVRKPFKYVPLGEGEINYKRILTDIRNNIKERIILSIETHVNNNKIQATLKSLKKLRVYLSQNRIKYAIVGAGRISHKHASAINKNDNSELRGVFDINNLRKSKFANKYDAVPYKLFGDLLNDTNIDIVNICTPHNTHLKITKKIVLNNKKVLCEKPFVLSSKDLLNALRNRKIRDNVFIVFQNNFNTPVKLLYELVNSRKLGKINYFAINLRWWRDRKYYSDGTEINYNQADLCLIKQFTVY